MHSRYLIVQYGIGPVCTQTDPHTPWLLLHFSQHQISFVAYTLQTWAAMAQWYTTDGAACMSLGWAHLSHLLSKTLHFYLTFDLLKSYFDFWLSLWPRMKIRVQDILECHPLAQLYLRAKYPLRLFVSYAHPDTQQYKSRTVWKVHL